MELADFIGPTTGAGSIVETVTTALSDAGPYILALFGLLVTVGVGMALLGRARKGIVASVKG